MCSTNCGCATIPWNRPSKARRTPFWLPPWTHPLLTASIATHTGWAIRIPGYAAGDLFTIQGSCMPFADTAAERQRSGDPRLSFEERYGSHAAWAALVAEATEVLVAERILLREDADRLIAAAKESKDVLAVL